jgi:threonine synthase
MTDKHDSESRGVRVSAANPFILEGEKTTGFEIIQEMGWKQPRAIVLPVGTGGHLAMTWRSLQELREAQLVDNVDCRLIGVQFRSSAPIVETLSPTKQFEPPDESITELEESEPIFKKAAVSAMKESNGLGVEVSSKEAIEATSLLARTEGIFAEPASASVIASLRTLRNDGLLDRDDIIVCVITGAGLKNTMVVKRLARTPKHVVAREEPLFRPLQVGPTKVRIMEALAERPEFGYALWKILKDSGEISTASVYQHLSELGGIGIVRRSRATIARGRERIYYELTEKGVELLNTVGTSGRKNGFVMV